MVSEFHYTDIMRCDEIRNTLLDIDSLDVDTARKIIKKLLDQNTEENELEEEVKDLEAKVEELEDIKWDLERTLAEIDDELDRAESRISELEEENYSLARQLYP